MHQIRVLIVEDEVLIAMDIDQTLRKHELEVTGICKSGEEALNAVMEERPDLVLMDIRLRGNMDGIETGKIIKQKYGISIIFLSDLTDSQTVERAKDVFPANYLSKPFNEADLIRAIDIAVNNLSEPSAPEYEKFLFLREGYKYLKLRYDDIIMIRAERAYCSLITEQQTFTFSKSLNKVAEQFNHPKLYRVSRSAVINLEKITKIEGNNIVLGAYETELSKNNRSEFFARLKVIR